MMQLSDRQFDILARYFADISKILVGSAVVGFFIPLGPAPVSFTVFIAGTVAALILLLMSIALSK